jgi:hypothetical protein
VHELDEASGYGSIALGDPSATPAAKVFKGHSRHSHGTQPQQDSTIVPASLCERGQYSADSSFLEVCETKHAAAIIAVDNMKEAIACEQTSIDSCLSKYADIEKHTAAVKTSIAQMVTDYEERETEKSQLVSQLIPQLNVRISSQQQRVTDCETVLRCSSLSAAGADGGSHGSRLLGSTRVGTPSAAGRTATSRASSAASPFLPATADHLLNTNKAPGIMEWSSRGTAAAAAAEVAAIVKEKANQLQSVSHP